MNHEDVSVVIVCYNTPELIVKAVESVMDHVFSVYIINLSDLEHECTGVCRNLSMEHVPVFSVGIHENIGHGPGLNLGVGICHTKYIIAMDSDAELLDPSLIDDMKAALEPDDAFGSGKVLTVQKNVPYLYMPFCMFKRDLFEMSPKFIHDGAPFIEAMKWAKDKYRMIQVDNFDGRLFHEGRATRKIAGHWRKGFGGREGI
jgi:glycosyltransferase involved in cell wall biosynthesis